MIFLLHVASFPVSTSEILFTLSILEVSLGDTEYDIKSALGPLVASYPLAAVVDVDLLTALLSAVSALSIRAIRVATLAPFSSVPIRGRQYLPVSTCCSSDEGCARPVSTWPDTN